MINQSSILQLQSIAQIACFQTEYQVLIQKKMQAENYFLQLIKNLSSSMFVQILRSGGDTLIFVTIQYANKSIEQYTQESLREIFNSVEGEVSSWYVPDSHQFRRREIMLINSNIQGNQSKQLTKYVLNSIFLFLSNCMKRFFIQDTFQKRSQIINWIGAKPNQRYKLWLFSIFIQNISQIDSSMGFIKFRSLSYNFQQQAIPVIAKCLIPFLYKVEDIMKVNQISLMQQHLNVEQNSALMNNHKRQEVFQNQNQLKFAALIFDLLHSLVFYNFHLTYTEYQQESTFDNCLICFPEEFTSKVVNQEFINCIGYVIQRLIDFMPKSKFLKTTLQCLQKIFLTKLSYVDQQRKMSFIKECAVTLTRILLKNNLDQDTLTRVMVCNNKFITNVQINYLKQKQSLKEAFHQWLLAITKTTFLVLENVAFSEQFNFNLEDSLVIQCLELYHKIVASLCSVSIYSFEETNKIDGQQKQYIEKNVQTITRVIVNKLFFDQSRPLIEGTTAQIFRSNIMQIKAFCSCFFQPFKQLASLNYGFLFGQIQKCIGCVSGISVKFNIFMLLTEIIDRSYLQKNIVGVKASDEQVYILSKCINMGLKYIQTYLKNKTQFPVDQQIILMDMSILIFLDKILSQFLGHFDNHEHSIEIKHTIFQNIIQIQNKRAYASNASEEFILFCIESVLSYLLIYNKNQESKHIKDFIFETINRILMKFKWGIKRQVFKSSQIYKRLLEFFNSVSKQTNIKSVQIMGLPLNLSLFNQFQRLKWRKKLLKIIALLYFDDVIDDYRKNLESLFSAQKNQHILTILLDIEGIGQVIDTPSIYKVFLEIIQKNFTVERLTNELVHFATSFSGYDKVSKKYPKVKIIKEIVKMHKAVLSNKGQRIGNPRNMQSVYMLIKNLIGYWIQFLKISDSEEWVSVVRQIIQTITQLIKCDKINFYLVQRVCTQEYATFFYEMFTKMLGMTQKIDEYPKFYQAFLQNIVYISRQLLGVMFFPTVKNSTPALQEKNKQICQRFIHIFLVIFKKIPVFLEQIKIGSAKNQNYLQKSLQIVKFTLTFIDCKKRQALTHREEMDQINSFIEEMKQLVFTYEQQIMNYLTSHKDFSVHRRALIIILYEATIIYPEMIEVLIGGMSLPNYLLNEVKQCLECIKKQQQQLFVDRFKTWLRMLHMSEEEVKKNKQQHSDFYGFMAII